MRSKPVYAHESRESLGLEASDLALKARVKYGTEINLKGALGSAHLFTQPGNYSLPIYKFNPSPVFFVTMLNVLILFPKNQSFPLGTCFLMFLLGILYGFKIKKKIHPEGSLLQKASFKI